MNFYKTHLLFLLHMSLALIPTITSAADGVRIGDISIPLGGTKAQVTESVLASKNGYSLQGGADDSLVILNSEKSLAAFVRFRNQRVIGIELVWSAESAAALASVLYDATHNLIGDSGILAFNLKPDPKTLMRFSSGNVTVEIDPFIDNQGQGRGPTAVTTTVGEHRAPTP